MRDIDQARAGAAPKGRLVPLGEMHDLQVAEGDTDIRGWSLCAAEGARLGRVSELIVDVDAMKVRYLEVQLDEGLAHRPAGRRVLLPVGYAHLAESAECVRVDAVHPDRLLRLPVYEPPLTQEYQDALYLELTGAAEPAPAAMSVDASAGRREEGA